MLRRARQIFRIKLERIYTEVSKSSVIVNKKVIEYRGKLHRDDDISYIWQRTTDREGSITYSQLTVIWLRSNY